MQQASHLWIFFGIVFGVVILPGLDMAIVLGSALAGGRRSGLAATAGIVAGGVCHVAVGAAGLATVLTLLPAAFNAVLLVGALYMAWIGLSLWRSAVDPASSPFPGLGRDTSLAPAPAAFRRGMLTNLTNPKAYAFMLAIFPQFVRPDSGPLWLQAFVLGVIIAITQVGVYGSLAWVAGQVRETLGGKPSVALTLSRLVGTALLLAAVFTGFEGWRRI